MTRFFMAALLVSTLTACIDEPDDSGDGDGGSSDGGGGDGGGGDGGGSGALLTEGFEARLDASGGCADTWLQAWDSDGSVGLELIEADILAEAISSGVEVSRSLVVGVDHFYIFVQVADPVAINYCTDALSERTIYENWTASSGTVLLTMAPPESEWAPGTASFSLDSVVFEDGAGHAVTVPTFSVAGVPVVQGWGG